MFTNENLTFKHFKHCYLNKKHLLDLIQGFYKIMVRMSLYHKFIKVSKEKFFGFG